MICTWATLIKYHTLLCIVFILIKYFIFNYSYKVFATNGFIRFLFSEYQNTVIIYNVTYLTSDLYCLFSYCTCSSAKSTKLKRCQQVTFTIIKHKMNFTLYKAPRLIKIWPFFAKPKSKLIYCSTCVR